MSFIDHRLNSRYGFGFVGGPEWSTLATKLRSGRRVVQKQWSMPHHKYSADYATFTNEEREEFINAFMVCGGSFGTFRFKDQNDFRAINQAIGVGDGSAAPIQLVKSYTFGPASLTRPITLPYRAVVSAAGEPMTVEVDPLTGLAVPETVWPVGEVLTWSGKFDVRVYFANDFNPLSAASHAVRQWTVALEEDFG